MHVSARIFYPPVSVESGFPRSEVGSSGVVFPAMNRPSSLVVAACAAIFFGLFSCQLGEVAEPRALEKGEAAASIAGKSATQHKPSTKMHLGTFSMSLAVKDLAASRNFYEKLGFIVIGGNPAYNYQILQSGMNTVGLFHGMFEDNIMTFNPGWSYDGKTLAKFTSVHEIQALLKKQGVSEAGDWSETKPGKARGSAISAQLCLGGHLARQVWLVATSGIRWVSAVLCYHLFVLRAVLGLLQRWDRCGHEADGSSEPGRGQADDPKERQPQDLFLREGTAIAFRTLGH